MLAPHERVFIKWMPWAHPHGHHFYPLINIPWAHLFVSEGNASARRGARVRRASLSAPRKPFALRAANGAMRANPFAGQNTLTDYLNRLSTRKLEAARRKAGLAVARKEAIPFSANRARHQARTVRSPSVSDPFCSAVAYDLGAVEWCRYCGAIFASLTYVAHGGFCWKQHPTYQVRTTRRPGTPRAPSFITSRAGSPRRQKSPPPTAPLRVPH